MTVESEQIENEIVFKIISEHQQLFQNISSFFRYIKDLSDRIEKTKDPRRKKLLKMLEEIMFWKIVNFDSPTIIRDHLQKVDRIRILLMFSDKSFIVDYKTRLIKQIEDYMKNINRIGRVVNKMVDSLKRKDITFKRYKSFKL
jgi:hypothetical protein